VCVDIENRIVVYDGHCRLCSRWVQFFQRHPVTPPFTLLPTQSAAGRALMIEQGIDPDDPTTFLVLDRGRIYSASDAAIHLMTSPGGLRRLWQATRIVPRSIRDWLYGVVARNRYRWFGRRAACDLPENPP
jgi:predicted DCC family thiol-disulfide oxidoreductase YuxK